MGAYQDAVREFCDLADIRLDGSRPGDPIIQDDRFFKRALGRGSLGLGESFMEGWWDCDRLDIFFDKLLSASLEDHVKNAWPVILTGLRARFFNFQKPNKALENVRHHYDIGNDLFKSMLDKRLVYSCGYWKDVGNVDEAQEAKLKLSCEKLKLEPGMHLLDIGCGWGSMARFAAEHYGVKVTGVTLSEEQLRYGNELCRDLNVELKLMDYRALTGKYDRIVSIGMFEHVGFKNFRTFFEVVNRCLTDSGLFLLHTIGASTTSRVPDPWIQKYIFPHGLIPSLKQITKAKDDLFVLEDFHNFGPDYDKTLMAWYKNFERAWPKLKDEYGETFYRMWRYYLLCCAGSFRARKNHLWQLVLSKQGVRGGYKPVR